MDLNNRDPADPEILRAGDATTGGGHFAEVAVERGGESGRFRFSVSAAGRTLIQRILGTRPFDARSGLAYRYYYAGQGGHGLPITHLLYVRIELGAEARTLEFEAPADLVTALEWFRRLPSLAAGAHLRTAV
jgi:hypothetical protein